jgi:hypothetical protein
MVFRTDKFLVELTVRPGPAATGRAGDALYIAVITISSD